MTYVRSLCLVATTLLTFSEARGVFQHKHEAVNIKQRRQGPNSPAQVPAVSTPSALTTIYPSPGASPILVTSQSALITTFIPQFTLCELPPIEGFTATASVSTIPTSPPYLDYSFSTPPGNGSCTTIYSADQSIVCATQLTDLTTTYTVTNCNQDITFSTEYGYSLILPTPTTSYANIASSPSAVLVTPPPSVQTLTTYYLAGWQALTGGGPPSDVKICEGFANGTEKCILEYYKWKTSLLTMTSQVTTSINLTTTILAHLNYSWKHSWPT
ncbi:hypothetical protein MRB53_041219 [Persea americana]|nr:hypothetical protein MRB53_041219 [Persea americana]